MHILELHSRCLTEVLAKASDSIPPCNAGSIDREHFYSELYSVTADPQKALHALLDKKEVFSQQVCQGVMSRLLGVECSFPVASAHYHLLASQTAAV